MNRLAMGAVMFCMTELASEQNRSVSEQVGYGSRYVLYDGAGGRAEQERQ